jgi:propanol-preferring alcohol dehydrogenase
MVNNSTIDGEIASKTQIAFGYEKGNHAVQKFLVPIPKPTGLEVLLKVEAAGLCQSDNHVLQVGPIDTQDPNQPVGQRFVMGHEIAGSIAQVGDELVSDTRYQVGKRFALQISHSCGVCLNCRRGRDNACRSSSYAYGLNADGGFQSYLLVKNLRTLLPIPDNVSYEVAAIASDSVLTPFHAIQKVKHLLSPTSKVFVVGLGGLGMNAIQILKAYGCYVVGSDIKPELHELALKLGANEYHTDMSQSNHEPESFDVCIDCAGVQPSSDACQKYVKSQGKYLAIGLGRSKLVLKNYELARREVEIIYSFGGTSHEQIEAMKWISLGKIKPLAQVVNFDELPLWMQKLRSGQIDRRIVFKPKL